VAAAEPQAGKLPLAGGKEGATVKVHPITTGTMMYPVDALFTTGGRLAFLHFLGFRSERVEIPIPCFLLEHPSAGPFLVDTGHHPSMAEDPKGSYGPILGRAVAKNIRMTKDEGLPDQVRARGVDPKDIKLAIHETILQFLREYSFDGWVSGKGVVASEEVTRELARLTRENADLRVELQSIRSNKKPSTSSNEDFDSILVLLADEFLTYEEKEKETGPIRMSVADWFYRARDSLVSGVSNSYDMSMFHNFLFFRLSPKLSVHGLTEDQKVAGVRWRTIKTTKKGNDLLAYLQRQKVEVKRTSAAVAPTVGRPLEESASIKGAAAATKSSAAKPAASSPGRKATMKKNAPK